MTYRVVFTLKARADATGVGELMVEVHDDSEHAAGDRAPDDHSGRVQADGRSVPAGRRGGRSVDLTCQDRPIWVGCKECNRPRTDRHEDRNSPCP